MSLLEMLLNFNIVVDFKGVDLDFPQILKGS